MMSVLSLISIVTALGAVVFAVVLLMQALQSAGWPRVTATVTESRVEKHGNTTAPCIAYAYTLGGQRYVSRRIGLVGKVATTGSGAQKLVDAHPVGTSVEVAVRPGDPSFALLRPGLQPLNVVLVVVPLVWGLVMLLVALA